MENYQNEFENEYQFQNNNQDLGKHHKIAAILLAIFAIFVVGMWMFSFKKNLTQSLNPASNTQSQINNDISGLSDNQDFKNKDTDKDGLSDYDELNIYNTSPYLADSDSDGFSDKEELNTENDPNCPVGRDCYDITPVANNDNNTNSSSISDQLGGQNIDIPTSDIQSSDIQEQFKQELESGNLDPETLRLMLLDAGMDEKMLSQISDEDLMKSFSEILEQQ